MAPTQISTALQALLGSLIDYAGLFPPAALDMRTAVENYARYKTGPHSWMLGRFVVPVARLNEFEQAWMDVGKPASWQLSALVAKPDMELPAAAAFNAKHAGEVQIDALELKASTANEIRSLPADIMTYVEIPVAANPTELLVAIKTVKHRAKIRTGGTTANMFPDAATIARFLRGCAGVSLPFKATAGLHHPLRCEKPFTYAPNSERGTMHGFINVFVAAAFARAGHPNPIIEKVLLEEQPGAFAFSDKAVEWRGTPVPTTEIQKTRNNFAIAFGSCSFEEPISDLQALGLLP